MRKNETTPASCRPVRAALSKHAGLRIAAVASAAVILAGCSKAPDADPRTEPPTVLTASAARASASVRRFSGVVAARVQSNLGFRVNGKIIERLVDVGQTVKRGQALMKLDPVDLDLVTTMKRAELKAARARSVQAIAEEARQAGLIKKGATSQLLFDDARAAADSARAQVELAEAALHTAENSGEYATLYADADGTVVDTLAEPGHVVASGETVIKLAHAGAREASVYLPETVRPGIGSVAIARVYGGDSTVKTRLRQLSDSADPATRTYEARYALDDDTLPLGATISIEIDGHADEVSVPLGAITDRGSGPGVWVLAPGGSAVSFRPVRVDKMGAEDALLSGGLKAGETVVALGAHLLSDGEQVRVAAEAANQEVTINE
jgi:RND family efflux transporter MFP subunit